MSNKEKYPKFCSLNSTISPNNRRNRPNNSNKIHKEWWRNQDHSQNNIREQDNFRLRRQLARSNIQLNPQVNDLEDDTTQVPEIVNVNINWLEIIHINE